MNVGISCIKGNVLWEDCLKCSDRCFPQLFLKIYLKNSADFQKERPSFSVSQLSLCLRRYYWQLTRDYYIGLGAVISAVYGTILHGGLHLHFKDNSSYLSEYKMTKVILGETVTGTLDLYCKETKTIYDFKTSSKIKPAYERQLNLYRQMLDLPVEKLKIVFIPLSKKPFVANIEITDKYSLEDRVRALKNSSETNIPAAEPDPDCNFCPFKEDCNDYENRQSS